MIEALQALRGVAQTTAATIVSGLGSLSRFPSPSKLMGYGGLVAPEHTTGNRVKRGGITKTGNSHLRLAERQFLLPPRQEAGYVGPMPIRPRRFHQYAVWRVMRREGIYLQRLRSWSVSTDEEFAPKTADVVGLYLNPPLNAVLLSVDEKPSMQAIERPSGYIETDSGSRGARTEEHL